MSQFIKEAAFSPSSPLLWNIVGRFVGKQALCLFRLHWLGGGTGQRKCTHTPTRGRAAGGALGASARHRRWFPHPQPGPVSPPHRPRGWGGGRGCVLRPTAAPPSCLRAPNAQHLLHLALQNDGAGATTASYSQSKLGLETVHRLKTGGTGIRTQGRLT